MKCERCRGAGSVWPAWAYVAPSGVAEKITCSDCDGTGKVGGMMKEQDVCDGKIELKEAGPDITLRDFFAGCTLMGSYASGGNASYEGFAEQSYRQADAMLKAREEE